MKLENKIVEQYISLDLIELLNHFSSKDNKAYILGEFILLL